MLNFKLIYKNKTEKPINNVLTAVVNADVGVPADDLTVTLPYDAEIGKNVDFIIACLDGEAVFKGQVDEIINIKNAGGVITKITARSLASGLLDNEAEPITYINPSADFIYEKHLKPFGFSEYDADGGMFFGALKIDKGMSHWQVFRNFCINLYGAEPRITGGGKALFKGSADGRTVLFGKGGLKYTAVKESLKRFKLITEVRLKLSEYGSYGGRIRNENPDCSGLTRVRYVNAVSDKTTVETADRIISRSNGNSFSVLLECLGCHIDCVGRPAVLSDEAFGKIGNLTIRKIRYTLDGSGEKTTVILGKESF